MSSGNKAHDFRLNIHATRVTASTVGILCGISGLEHGIFETLQGNAMPGGLLISAIGPANRYWPGGTETALTIIPNFFITGILAILASIMVIVWSSVFIHRKHGAAIFLLLSIVQFLVGGGFAQIFLVLVTAAAATQINAPLTWWRDRLPTGIRRALVKSWLGLLVVFLLLFSGAIVAAVFGYFPVVSDLFNPSVEKMTAFLYGLGYFMLGLLPLTFLAGFARDIESLADPDAPACFPQRR
jgi:hypothetical protein